MTQIAESIGTSPEENRPALQAGDSVSARKDVQADVQGKAMRSMKAVGLSTFVTFVLRTISSLVLARFLTSSDYGLFGVIAPIIGLGLTLGEGGVANTLITQKSEPTDEEISTVFWLQQGTITLVVVAILAAIPAILLANKLTPDAALPIAVMTLTLYTASLRIVPVMLQERSLHFDVLSKAEMTEGVVQVVLAVLFALNHMGIWTLILSSLIARCVSLVIIWRLLDHRPQLVFRPEIARRYLLKGSRFQLNVLIPPALAQILPVVVNRSLGLSAFGFVIWATNQTTPLGMLSAVLNRVAFPAFSQMESGGAEIGTHAVETARRMLVVLSVLLTPVAIFCPLIIPVLFGSRWLPAIPLLQILLFDTANQVVNGFIAQAITAREHLTERLVAAIANSLLRAAAAWVFAQYFGLVGVALGMLFGTVVEMILLSVILRRLVPGGEDALSALLFPLTFLQGIPAIAILAAQYGAKEFFQQPGMFVVPAIATVLSTLLLLAYDRFSPGHPLSFEAQAIYGRLRQPRGRLA